MKTKLNYFNRMLALIIIGCITGVVFFGALFTGHYIISEISGYVLGFIIAVFIYNAAIMAKILNKENKDLYLKGKDHERQGN